MRPTIYTVAQRAGVSIATVSRVLNDSARTTEETRAKVLRAVRELGYQPSSAARSLAGSGTETIALLFPEISGPFISEIIRGIETEAHRRGYHLLIYGLEGDRGDDPLLRFLSTKVDGMILGSYCDGTHIQSMQRQGIPLVLMCNQVDGTAVDSIFPDDFSGAHEAVTHLIQHDYQRIAFVGDATTSTHKTTRFEAYRQALEDHSWPSDPRWVMRGDYSEQSGRRAMEELLKLPQPPRAVFAANDQMAIGALDVVHNQGLRVPDDVAIVGFDDIPAAAYVNPPLTTVRQNIRESGELAVQLLLRRIEELETEVENIVLPTQLVVRRSCGCDVLD
ncbi:MAG TPA: LacI family DNA-binding transcriptional regulator [Anaerolineae bacterium]|nr:LacI family DNA-binding transcriptional regulator [Anaerolineae bacterium]